MLDDIADDPGEIHPKMARLDDMRQRLEACALADHPDPVFAALGDAIRRFDIPIERLTEVVQGVTQDLYVDRYADFAQLEEYCRLVASSVGLACLSVFGCQTDEAAAPAHAMGVAMQLTNVLRDVGVDAALGRIYLPLDELERFGVAERHIFDGHLTPELRRVLAHQAQRAHAYYDAAQPLFGMLPRRSRPCPMVMFGVYRRLLEAIEASQFNVFRATVRLSAPKRARTAFALWVKGLLWKPVA